MRHRVQIEAAGMDPLGKVRDIFRLPERHAQALESGYPCPKNGFGIRRPQVLLHPLPDGSLGAGGNLLPDDVVDHRGKQIAVHLPGNMPQLIDRRTQPLVLAAEIRKLLFAVLKLHKPSSFALFFILPQKPPVGYPPFFSCQMPLFPEICKKIFVFLPFSLFFDK